MARWSLKEPLPDHDCVVLVSFGFLLSLLNISIGRMGLGRYIIVTDSELPASLNDGFLILLTVLN